MNRKPTTLFLLALLTAAAVTASAQIGTDPSIVYIPVSATDSDGRFISGLKAEEFTIEEDKTPQQIVSLYEKNIPISVAVMLDVRGTTKDALKSAATSYFMSSNPSDQLFLVESGDKPLNEAAFQGLNNLLQRGTNPIRAFVLVTDRTNPGADSLAKVKDVLKDQVVEFFVLGLTQQRDPSSSQDQDLLRDLARMSGGEAFFPTWVGQADPILRTMAVDLRHQYMIGYRPTNLVQDGKWRKITVTGMMTKPGTDKVMTLTIRAKSGYYAPTLAAHRPQK